MNIFRKLSYAIELSRLARGPYKKSDSRKKRVREIGNVLKDEGGFTLMLQVHKIVRVLAGKGNARLIESWWDGIGSWRG